MPSNQLPGPAFPTAAQLLARITSPHPSLSLVVVSQLLHGYWCQSAQADKAEPLGGSVGQRAMLGPKQKVKFSPSVVLVTPHVFLQTHVVRGNPHRTTQLGVISFCHCRKSCRTAPPGSTETTTPRVQTRVLFTFPFRPHHSPWRHTGQARPSIPEQGALAGAPARSQGTQDPSTHLHGPLEGPFPGSEPPFPQGKGVS